MQNYGVIFPFKGIIISFFNTIVLSNLINADFVCAIVVTPFCVKLVWRLSKSAFYALASVSAFFYFTEVNHMKKKLTSLLLTFFMLFSLCACSKNTDNNSDVSHTQCTFGEWVIISNPTCTKNGTKRRTCSICHKNETQSIEKTEHDYTETIINIATCDKLGVKAYHCKNCGYEYTETFELQAYTPKEIYDIASKSAVEILTFDKNVNELAMGSGFVLTKDGKIVTNYHVIDSACSSLVNISNTYYNVDSVLAYDISIDLAVLQINATNLEPVKTCINPLSVGEPVYALGSSRGLTNTFTQGIVTSSKREIGGVTYVQHDAAISSGNSGGMLLNKYCEVIGINTFTIRDSQNLNFAIFTSELDNLSYGSPMTLRELYEKEGNPFKKVKKYAKEKGSYDSENGYYYKVIGTSYTSDGLPITRGLIYSPSTDIITFIILYENYGLDIALDEVYYSYDWSIYDYSTENYMEGILYADKFTKDTTYLYYSETNIYYSSVIPSFNKFAAGLASILISCLDADLAEINVTAYDLDFLNF